MPWILAAATVGSALLNSQSQQQSAKQQSQAAANSAMARTQATPYQPTATSAPPPGTPTQNPQARAPMAMGAQPTSMMPMQQQDPALQDIFRNRFM